MIPPDLNRVQLSVQLLHWEQAIRRLSNLDSVAAPEGWHRLERQTNTLLRASMSKSIRELESEANRLRESFDRLSVAQLTRGVLHLRRNYLRTETMLDFFADAINSRSADAVGRLLAGLDRLAFEGMQRLLEPLGHKAPPVVTYIDGGLGASILKAGLRLWDRRSINPVASIKVVRHNLLTATSVLHELGHQVAHITRWTDELRDALRSGLPSDVSETISSWAPEVAADAIAFVYAGQASLSALRNVVDGGAAHTFRFIPGDPHPIGMLRVLMVSDFAKRSYGVASRDQPWLVLEKAWLERYPVSAAPDSVRKLITRSIPVLPRISELVLQTSYRSLGNKRLVDLVDPARVSPTALDRFEAAAGPRAFELPYVVRVEAIRLLALSGLRLSGQPARGPEYFEKQRRALAILGSQALAA